MANFGIRRTYWRSDREGHHDALPDRFAPSLDKMRMDIPESVLELLTIPGLRPEKVLKLHKELGIDTVKQLEVAAKQDRLKGLKGLGPALQRKILAKLETTRNSLGARHIHRAADLLETARGNLETSKLGLKSITVAGDLRRARLRLGTRCGKGSCGSVSAQVWRANGAIANQDRLGAALLFATGCSQRVSEDKGTSASNRRLTAAIPLANSR
jgi:DNA polymerase (family X)